MKKLLTLLAVGSIAFGVVSAAAASLGSLTSGPTISAATLDVSSCATGTVAATYTTSLETVSSEKVYQVTEIVLTSTGGNFTGCLDKKAFVAINGTADSAIQDLSVTDGTGAAKTSSSNSVLTLDITNTNASSFVDVAILIKG